MNDGEGETEILHIWADSLIEASIYLKKTEHFFERDMSTEIEYIEGDMRLIDHSTKKYFRIKG